MRNLGIIIGVIAALLAYAQAEAKSSRESLPTVTGRVADTEGGAVAYATVVAMQGSRQSAGTTTDDGGAFSLTLPAGEYKLSFEFLGYKSVERTVSVSGSIDLGEIILENDDIRIESVEVTAQIIRREADRFVVDVANMPSSIGKDGVDLLRNSPGVFVNDDKISINGKSGTKVYVNEREVKYTGERLLTYLRSLKSDDIQKIEVIPIAGVEYDADSSAGIIKITLKRKRDDGVMGSVSYSMSLNDMRQAYAPSAFIDYRTGRWTLSASGNYFYNNSKMNTSERQTFPSNDNVLTSESKMYDNSWQYYGAKVGALCDLDNSHSIGAEFEYNAHDSGNKTDSWSNIYDAATRSNDRSDGLYTSRQEGNTISARFNYIGRLDTLGSTVKVLADYTRQTSASGNDYNVVKIFAPDGLEPLQRDSIYRDNASTNYNITTVGVDYAKIFSQKFNIRTGGKYTNNIMASDSRYDYLLGDVWHTRPAYNYDVKYTENIAALYLSASSQLGRWSLAAGLRGEYTATNGRDRSVRQNYFSLFPSASVSYALKKDNSYSLIAQYSRNITRPNFWSLSPVRTQMSEYLYQVGNPELEPAFDNRLLLSLVMKYKYTISAGANFSQGGITQVITVSDDDPNLAYVRTENLDREDTYYMQISLPFQFFKWWSANVNATGILRGTRIRRGEPQVFHPMLYGNVSTTFNLPREFYLNIDYNYVSKSHFSNIEMNEHHYLSFSVKKRMFNDRLSLSVGAYNLIPAKNEFTYSDTTFKRLIKIQEGWLRPTFAFSASYNFNRGKKFDKKSLESGADTGRLSK